MITITKVTAAAARAEPSRDEPLTSRTLNLSPLLPKLKLKQRTHIHSSVRVLETSAAAKQKSEI